MSKKFVFGFALLALMACGKDGQEFLGSVTQKSLAGTICTDTAVSGDYDSSRIPEVKRRLAMQGSFSESPCSTAGATGSCEIKQSQNGGTAHVTMHFFGMPADQVKEACDLYGGSFVAK